ncbi:hypothetical protein [Oenococcus oeni]|uniref:hypothetical protein n=1 Tax=Oenococcus oeni TaxID=1247 RepID=UPI000A4076F6|nr:hypothetical protein [Oenococcus oeni]SYW04422.1 conserved membrane hypothetical protein [Oenococcus oeni]SYW09042.1 conserved membrane hypothetical protein [Oenococcus oeni]SYW10602.1 conserved membrane hypothetical protein [Oenococcus oeni]SYW12721.1 conserved membrane hypothetical protein [Oenococcus oeni]
MISWTLMKQTIKNNATLWSVITIVQAAMLILLSSIGIKVAATGQMYYNLLPEILSAIYIMVTGNKLLAAQVDRGTMAYILSTPVKRIKVALTQASFFVASLFSMFLVTSLAHAVSALIAFNGISSNDVEMIVKLNLGLFCLTLAFSGICFLASCIFNLSKYATGTGGFIVGSFLLISLVPLFSQKLADLKYFTIVTLYDLTSIIAGNSDFIIKALILAGIGALTYIVGTAIFIKKDLPI